MQRKSQKQTSPLDFCITFWYFLSPFSDTKNPKIFYSNFLFQIIKKYELILLNLQWPATT